MLRNSHTPLIAMLRSQILLAIGVGLLSTACGSDKSSGDSSGLGSGKYPACGTDPAKQPSPCIDPKGAVRCKANSGFPGDELALCEPDPSEGMLIHIGPTDYSDPNQMAAYLMDPGGEQEFCLKVNTTNTEAKFLGGYHGRMRPYSHHWIVTETAPLAANETVPVVCQPIGAVTERWLLASQWPTFDIQSVSGGDSLPNPGDPDDGLSRQIQPNQTLNLDLHYANFSTETILREAWATLSFKDPSEVKTQLDVISWINLNIQVPPLAHYVTPRFSTTAPTDTSGQQQSVYLGFTTAHAHKRLQRLSLYQNDQLIYEARDWHEPGQAYYRDAAKNPDLPVTTGATWGAVNHYVKINPGDTMSFECEYQNDLNTTVTFGETTKDEMCNVFGFYYPTLGHTWTVVQ